APVVPGEPPSGEPRVTTRTVDTSRRSPIVDALITVSLLAGGVLLGQISGLVLGDSRERIPAMVQLHAVFIGMPQAVFAVALVLVYRSARVINFSIIAIAGGGAIIFAWLHQDLE